MTTTTVQPARERAAAEPAAPDPAAPDLAAPDLVALARERFGYEELRPGQAEAARALVAGRDVLAVMPTGHGKSAVYQLAALAIPGPTIVVSPLIALQRDQVESLSRTGTSDAVALNSAQSRRATDAAWAALGSGEAEFVFAAPEQLARDDVVERLAALRPSLLVVDEAHCVSAWGHDFRPDYLQLGSVVERLGRPVVAALTATAAPPVRAEIVERLGMRDPLQVVQGFDRPNIYLEVTQHADEARRREEVVLRAAAAAKPGLVYVATRRDAEAYADELSHLGLDVEAYHAGMRAAERSWVHEAFTAGDLDVVVATSAFGMGIDKADVRFVLHAAAPDSLDAYYQEIGRAGRDGEPALASMLYRTADLGVAAFHAGGGADEELLTRVGDLVRGAGGALAPTAVREQLHLSATRVTGAVNLLEAAGALEVTGAGDLLWADAAVPARAAAHAAGEVAAARGRVERTRTAMLRSYAETSGCRRRFLLGYFGQDAPAQCGQCDTCRAGTAAQADVGDGSWPVGTRVEHAAWGAGEVVREEGDRVTVLFADEGYKTLALAAIAAHDLLRRAA